MITVFSPLVSVWGWKQTFVDRDLILNGSFTLPGYVYMKPEYLDQEYKALKMPNDAKVSDVSKDPSVCTDVSKYVDADVDSLVDKI